MPDAPAVRAAGGSASAPPTATLRASRYRPEIDGLRAIAVWAVILYHADVPFLPAGFLGVDIFFVISGYLISRMLIGDLEAGRFSILRFYERRIRRIIPALVVMTLIFTPVAFLLMIPGNLKSFGQSLVATTLSANNVLLYLTVSYFDMAADFKPLIHTWSLGVEEQYYLAVPLLMLVAYRWRARRGALIALLVIAALSLAYCLWASRHAPAANFYLIFSRAWELAAGAIVALGEPRWRRTILLPPMTSEALAGAALALTILPLALLDPDAASPNARTLLPVSGVCALLLVATPPTLIGRLLGSGPMVGFGLLSYSAYLYHQPLFAFARLTALTTPSAMEMAALIVASFACAYLSWRFIEKPFRDRARTSTRRLLMFCAGASALVLAAGMAMQFGNGFPQAWPADIRADDGLNAARNARYVDGPRRFTDRPFNAANPRPNVLVLGDSFARDVINMGVESGYLADKEISYSEGTGCGQALDAAVVQRARQADLIVLTAAFENNTSACLLALHAAVARHSQARVVIVGTKNFGLSNNAVMLLPPAQRYTYRTAPLPKTTSANAIAERAIPPAMFVNILKLIADRTGRVPVFTPDRRLISQDTHHLTRAGARYIGGIVFHQPVFAAFDPERAKLCPPSSCR
ncbi:acyltransferase family protein [Sphingomonas qilianensis]|uniref:Acyltransferase family protein n=1 Tax=Sphingomonas qilianensis TaxID=1736690 RepID=A0ABU9XNM2_9SPHN